MGTARKTTIITDPIHQVMNLGSDPDLQRCFKRVLDTREFQRLRRITQLGLTSYVFPGATHTRFSHGLGAAHLAHAVLRHLLELAENDKKTQGEIKTVFNEVIMAALLHDVGHGPFSHLFEDLLPGRDWVPEHEDWTGFLITNSDIQKVLTEETLNPVRVASAITKTTSTSSSLPRPYRQIVSSQIDVDRMDYLLRDSHFAGVAIGQFDAHYLINSITIVDHAGSQTLGLTPKGIKAYEAFLLARQLMNRTVYYHHNVKVLEYMLQRVLQRTIEELPAFEKNRAVSAVLPPYFRKLHTAISSNRISKAQFMEDSLPDYVRLTEDVIWVLIAAVAESPVVPKAQSLAKKLLTRRILPHFLIRSGKEGLLKEALATAGFIEHVDFHVLDLETTMYKGNGGDKGVFVRDADGTIEDVTKRSEIIAAFRDRPEAESLLVVVDESRTDEIEKLAGNAQFIFRGRFTQGMLHSFIDESANASS